MLLLTPQLYTGLRFRGHVALRIGAQIPIAGTDPFHYRIGAALVWEYLEGGLWVVRSRLFIHGGKTRERRVWTRLNRLGSLRDLS